MPREGQELEAGHRRAEVEYERHKIRRAVGWVGRLTGSGLRPAARWSLRLVQAGMVAAVTAGVTLWLGG
jgi:hypothetical protein